MRPKTLAGVAAPLSRPCYPMKNGRVWVEIASKKG